MARRIVHSARVPLELSRFSCWGWQHVSVFVSSTAAASTVAAAPRTTLSHTSTKPSYPSTQPPSHKPPEFRKSQLLRQYASLLRSSPLILLFQHNNLKANEWLALRRELTQALRKLDKTRSANASMTENGSSLHEDLASLVKIQIVQTGIFAAALRVVEYFKPDSHAPSDPLLSAESASAHHRSSIPFFRHTLSKAANRVASRNMNSHELSPLLSGPICVLSFPIVTPDYLKESISILSPSPPDFPAPRKKTNPGWHDPAVQDAIHKLVLLGARIEGKAFDTEGAKMVGNMKGGLEGLQGQLVAMLQNIGTSLTNTLESAGKNIYFTLESRRSQLNDNQNGKSKTEGNEAQSMGTKSPS